MNIISKSMRAATALLALPLLLINVSALSQEQVLAEVGAVGEFANGDQGVVRTDFTDEETGDYTDWVTPAASREFKTMAITPTGTVLVLDGTTIREFTSSGAQITDAGYPVDCTAVTFDITEPNGMPGTDIFKDCGAFTPLNDGTIRIAGRTMGGGFDVIEYDPVSGVATSKAAGKPPSISDMDADESEEAATRRGPGYWTVGNRKTVLFFPLASEKDFEVVATLNGVRIDGVTPFGAERVIVALDSGELLQINTTTGVATSFAFLPTGTECGLGKKDPQKFSLRGQPGGTLFVGNLGCHEINIYDENLQVVATNDELVANPFELNSPESLFITGLDWQIGESGDFDACQGASQGEGCQFGAEANQAVMFGVQNIAGTDTTFRMYQFVDLFDCRHTGDRPCPIINCPAAQTAVVPFGGNDDCETDLDATTTGIPAEQVLDLTPLLIAADVTNSFESAAFPDGLEFMAIPAYLRGEKCFPADTFTGPDPTGNCADNEVFNNFKFISFFAVTDAIFTGTFFVDYEVDEFRIGSADPCVIPPPNSLIPDINETANIILYNSGNGFGTVNRGGAEGTRGGTIGNSFCNGGATRARWSANSIGLELFDDSDTAYIIQVERMMAELFQTKTDLICTAFPNTDDGTLGPLLLGTDCGLIENALDLVEQKLGVCIDSLFAMQQGASAENCNAFRTKITNLKNTLDAAAWPNPDNPANLDVLRPNYEGEFDARIDTLKFFVESYMLNGVPPGGI